MMMMIDTKLYNNNQTTVPAEIRNAHSLQADDIIEWVLSDDNTVHMNFRKKVTLNEMKGAGKTSKNTNALELEKELYR